MISGITAGNKLLKSLDIKTKGNFLGKAKAFASKLGKTLGSEDESVEVFEDKSVYAQTGADVGGELRGRREREREAAAAAEQKKKMTSYIMIGAALVLIMFIKKK